ncbi:MAG: hypothetical protein Q4C85_00530 [Actinomyces sp.]|uniref:lipopolysaccharide biosynthesis protein n=1 Tax=Actinomyces sp. TaxID=29317 RepID=UPI0026DD2B52|nr:hypothetical protein [Actinomyces sp.]MDO4242248.1 hypothetical protein [Actinomyces sp.]
MPSEARRVILRLLGFTGWPLLTLVTPLLAMPVVARLAGQGWSSMATAMSVGTFGAAAVLWGWNYVGPARVARVHTVQELNRLYSGSVLSRSLLCLGVVPVCAVISAWLALPSLRVAAGATAVAFVLPAMSPQWYCIGVGDARLLGYFDTLPRTISTVIAIPLMVLTGKVIFYPCLLAAGVVIGLVLFRRSVFPGVRADYPSLPEVWDDIRHMSGAAGSNLVGAAYGYTPTPIATAALDPAISSRFASADQVYRYALFLVQALGNALQGWVLEVDGEQGRRRQRLAIMAHVALGLCGAIVIAVLTPLVSSVLFGPQVAATYAASAWYGVAFFAISTATPLLRNVLIPTGQAHAVFIATVVAAVGGLGMMAAGAAGHSMAVIAAGMACSELLIFLILLPRSLRTLRRMGAQCHDGASGSVPGTEPGR